jgi:hypothetical protein
LDFEIVGHVQEARTIAIGSAIRDVRRLRRVYGPSRWRKRKGIARLRMPDGTIRRAEIHWYEARGLGRKEIKIKRWVEV